MNPQRPLRSIKTRFAIRFLRSLKKISNQKSSRRSSYHKVKTAAYVSMAYVVGPRRAWARAMLLKLRWQRRSSRNFRIRASVIVIGGRKRKKKKKASLLGERKKVNQNSFRGREEKLRKIVPGVKGMDMLSLLDETADYINCLAAQVMVMRSIVNYCSN